MGDFLAAAVARAGLDWFNFKVFLERTFAFSHDSLHVVAGVLLQLILAALLRVSLASPWPWLIVLALELANEWNDIAVEAWPDPAMQIGEGAKDLLLTMALPTVLLVIARRWPGLLRKGR
jgi:hypothetical protein